MEEDNQLIKERKEKLQDIRKAGKNPYSYRFDKQITAGELQKKYGHLKKEESLPDVVKTAGRIMMLRRMGKVTFITLRDGTGKIQLYFKQDDLGNDNYKFLKKLDIGDIIGLEGSVFATKTGELTIAVRLFEILTKSLHPLPEKFHGLKEKELRYRQRYLDLIMNPEVREAFMKRAEIIQGIREFLLKRGFIEVETPILQPIYGGTSAKPFESKLHALDMTVFMRISNEMYLKRLLVGGYDKIFEFSQDFRNEGIDKTHNPEFLLMETMWAYADYRMNMDLTEEMFEFLAKRVTGGTKVRFQGKEIDFKRPWKRITMVDAIKEYVGIDIEKLSDDEIQGFIKEKGLSYEGSYNRGIAMEFIFGELVEEKLIQPTMVYDYPFETCGLAKPKKDNPRFAERFEPYINGWELGNSYSELNDPQILKEYWEREEKRRAKESDEEAQRLDTDFIRALEYGMPPASGLGIGVDRLVMLLTDSVSIRDVILFPFMKPEAETE
ncbi:lysine--tRNA ligase [Candidatus Woesearchaeota archaeon]|nr:lysine--tRNA ligase [Candidatus Woesearchaeota archaeon]